MTLTAIELDEGDELHFRMLDGQIRRIRLVKTVAWPIRRGRLPFSDRDGLLLYAIACTLEIDGHQVELVRRIPSQSNFTPPPVIMGMRIWLDAVAGIADLLTEKHGECFPRGHARFAVWDARVGISPTLLHPWCPLPEGGLRVEECYRGEDTWLGPYDGADAHGGLDIDHAAGTPLWTPFRIDEHGYFESLAAGDKNNRWRGVHRWDDGSSWILQSHHLIRLLVPEGKPIEAGVQYAESGGVYVAGGFAEHSHFVFRVEEGGEQVMLDPWLLFWQMYEDRGRTQRAPVPAAGPL
ncbi:hypothetical protein L2X99_10870 [Microbacterium sp. KUDC0406]|uniref:hypothetical protein n=1 Tax=Microbacterium sp. KUDC0406 TaxID=2909588 RepID=UPI001F289870|nr:hypothetical protein [Microbacterium sp. KUDC0406]UJP08977.1 hypothetical protein L2X99_10870 [Microbacterium sp. KUDC0406]